MDGIDRLGQFIDKQPLVPLWLVTSTTSHMGTSPYRVIFAAAAAEMLMMLFEEIPNLLGYMCDSNQLLIFKYV